VDSGIFVNNEVQVRIRNVLGPNGVSLFESPEDEFAAPVLLADSEDGLPDTITTPVGLHRHMNWAFESPGAYLVKVQARGRLTSVAGNPWVNSPNVVLKFVVLP
jgi:surface-anchored protein